MIIPKNNEDILDLLIYKWLSFIKLSATEEVRKSWEYQRKKMI
jgi:hypothetical protein